MVEAILGFAKKVVDINTGLRTIAEKEVKGFFIVERRVVGRF